MINLEKSVGLPIKMRDDFTLEFAEPLKQQKPDVRDFSAMKNYLKDPSASYWRKDVYHMYRDIALPEHAEAVLKEAMQYDITVIPPGMIGDEFVKTIGHYHSIKQGTHVRYPEVYEVIYGRVFLLLQHASEDLERVQDVILIDAGRGEKVLVPPGYGHVSINPTDDVLVLSNWQPRANKSSYEQYEAHNGAAYYVIRSERLNAAGGTTTEYEPVPNLHYNQVPEIIRARPRELPQYEFRSALPMYFTSTQSDFKNLRFLTNPEEYIDDLTPEKLFSS